MIADDFESISILFVGVLRALEVVVVVVVVAFTWLQYGSVFGAAAKHITFQLWHWCIPGMSLHKSEYTVIRSQSRKVLLIVLFRVHLEQSVMSGISLHIDLTWVLTRKVFGSRDIGRFSCWWHCLTEVLNNSTGLSGTGTEEFEIPHIIL
jgi:hypothetical protein